MHREQQQQTLQRWLNEYQGTIYKIVRIYAFSHHDHEDLYQEVVFQVWQSIPRFKGEAKENTYVYQVALFAAMAWNRKEESRRERANELVECQASLADPGPQDNDNPRVDWLYEQISKMRLVDRSLMLLLLDGYSYREIANFLGLSESNVGSRLSRLKKSLSDHSKQSETHEL